MNVRTLCLGYLSLRAATGYEIKKDFGEGVFCHFFEAGYGSIYPALNQLAADGLVSAREEEQAGKPDKKVYSITDKGRAELAKALSALPARDKYKSEFLFIMLMQQHVGQAQKLAAMKQQIRYLREDLASIAECRAATPPDPACTFVMGYGEAVLTAAVSYLETHLAELEPPAASAAAE